MVSMETGNKPDVPRSPQWPAVRARHLLKEPRCAVCSTPEHVQCHHKKPFHLFPELELVDDNLITLCESPGHNCHLLFGHLLFWPAYNPNVTADAVAWKQKIQGRLQA
jgi:5-methylcytosine-specific restriction enzyme A